MATTRASKRRRVTHPLLDSPGAMISFIREAPDADRMTLATSILADDRLPVSARRGVALIFLDSSIVPFVAPATHVHLLAIAAVILDLFGQAVPMAVVATLLRVVVAHCRAPARNAMCARLFKLRIASNMDWVNCTVDIGLLYDFFDDPVEEFRTVLFHPSTSRVHFMALKCIKSHKAAQFLDASLRCASDLPPATGTFDCPICLETLDTAVQARLSCSTHSICMLCAFGALKAAGDKPFRCPMRDMVHVTFFPEAVFVYRQQLRLAYVKPAVPVQPTIKIGCFVKLLRFMVGNDSPRYTWQKVEMVEGDLFRVFENPIPFLRHCVFAVSEADVPPEEDTPYTSEELTTALSEARLPTRTIVLYAPGQQSCILVKNNSSDLYREYTPCRVLAGHSSRLAMPLLQHPSFTAKVAAGFFIMPIVQDCGSCRKSLPPSVTKITCTLCKAPVCETCSQDVFGKCALCHARLRSTSLAPVASPRSTATISITFD